MPPPYRRSTENAMNEMAPPTASDSAATFVIIHAFRSRELGQTTPVLPPQSADLPESRASAGPPSTPATITTINTCTQKRTPQTTSFALPSYTGLSGVGWNGNG